MAQSHSFDIVSDIDLQEVDNTVNQTQKEVTQRYDFKGIATTIDLNKKDRTILLTSGDEFHLKSVVDILQTKAIKRGISMKALSFGSVEQAPGGSVRQTVSLKIGIGKEDAKKIVALIKGSKRKVQAQIMDEQVRVTGKDKDDLQQVIALLKQQDLPFPMQFVNYR